jgi:AcrR family transcriptional regulator
LNVDRTARKHPQQERSRAMRERILEASLRVLQEEGALGFTTTRVADEAGISVGSLYQYFPNKHSLVMELHRNDVATGWARVESILDGSGTPREKVRKVTTWFFLSETEEVAQMGGVTGEIEVFLQHGIESEELFEVAIKRLSSFIAKSSSHKHTRTELRFAAEFALTTIESVGKSVARRQVSTKEVERWARATAAYVCDSADIRS